MAKRQTVKITDIQTAIAVIAHEAVPCFCGKERQQSTQPKRLTSCTGGAFWGLVGETWPVSADGDPLIPWLQIVCTEMKRLYGAFHNRQAICFYLSEGFSHFEAAAAFDRSDFVVREYTLDAKLAPLTRPSSLAAHPYHRIEWTKCDDYPCVSKYYELFDEAVYDAICAMKKLKYDNHSGIKIGGWPTPVQQDQPYPGSYDLQIDITQNFMYGDSGVGYLSRNRGEWGVIFECC